MKSKDCLASEVEEGDAREAGQLVDSVGVEHYMRTASEPVNNGPMQSVRNNNSEA